jgi:thioredoxin-related protein
MKISSLIARSFRSAFVCAALAAPLALHAQPSKPGWSENEAQALEKAKTDKKLVLMDFTGSDWCGWCMKMDKEVFSTPEFKQYAQDHLVLVEVDYPHEKVQTPDVKKQNDELQKKYGIQGFPTILVLDGDGNKVGEFVGYQEGGAKAFIDQLSKLKS